MPLSLSLPPTLLSLSFSLSPSLSPPSSPSLPSFLAPSLAANLRPPISCDPQSLTSPNPVAIKAGVLDQRDWPLHAREHARDPRA
eukprot:1523346-Rhodomonas_salina.1